MQTNLTFEKTETLAGITVYKVFYGTECLKREEEIGPNKQTTVDGGTVAYSIAYHYYQDCLQKVKAGYPKTTLLASSAGLTTNSPHLLEQIEGVISFLIKKKKASYSCNSSNPLERREADYYKADNCLDTLISYRDELTANHFDHVNK